MVIRSTFKIKRLGHGKKIIRGKKVQVKCKNECCVNIKEVRQSDVKRGWGCFAVNIAKPYFKKK